MNTHEVQEWELGNRRRLRWGLTVFLAIALFFLWEEHRAHLLGALPWILLLACPAMHLFMHRGHRGHAHRSDQRDEDDRGRGEAEHQHGSHGCH